MRWLSAQRLQQGFTFPEVILVGAIIAILALTGIASFSRQTVRASLDANLLTVVSDIKNQQLKAMTGANNETEDFQPFGVYFEPTRYTLFRGTSYSVGNLTNFVINLDNSVQASTISLPGNQIIFATRSGEVENFDQLQREVTFTNTTNSEQKTLQFNKFGVVVSAN